MAYQDYDEDEFDDSYGIGELEAAPIEFPEELGVCIDKLYVLRSQRLVLVKEVAERKRTEKAYREHIVSKLREIKMEGGKGGTATASITEKIEPTPKDWPAIWAWVAANDAFDMLQKRLSGKAVKERWDQNEVIPGIEKFTVVDLSLKKR